MVSTCLLAEPTQYITDKVYAPVRSEAGEKGKLVHNGIESGTAVTILDRNDQTGFARIRTPSNIEGWIRTQYLTAEPTASVQLEQANAQVAQLQSEKNQLEEQLVSIKQIAASQIDIHERNAELVKQNQLLTSEKEVLQTDNERLKDRNNQTWFLYGGILVVLSSIISALLPRLGKKRRNDGWA
jgi:SH3 domain protein